MANIKVENLDSQAVPFFARFLENQNCEDVSAEEMEKINGGNSQRPITTQKFPNDVADTATTKAHFDQETFVTLKYPSDAEESGAEIILQ